MAEEELLVVIDTVKHYSVSFKDRFLMDLSPTAQCRVEAIQAARQATRVRGTQPSCGDSPRFYLGDVRQLGRFIEDTYPRRAIAGQFVARLKPSIRDTVVAKYEGKSKDKWFGLLDSITEYAESVWMSLSGEQSMKPQTSPDSAGRSCTGQSPHQAGRAPTIQRPEQHM